MAEKKSIFIKEVEPIIVYDASSHIDITETSQILNESGIPFEEIEMSILLIHLKMFQNLLKNIGL